MVALSISVGGFNLFAPLFMGNIATAIICRQFNRLGLSAKKIAHLPSTMMSNILVLDLFSKQTLPTKLLGTSEELLWMLVSNYSVPNIQKATYTLYVQIYIPFLCYVLVSTFSLLNRAQLKFISSHLRPVTFALIKPLFQLVLFRFEPCNRLFDMIPLITTIQFKHDLPEWELGVVCWYASTN